MPQLRVKIGNEPLGDPIPLSDNPIVIGRAQTCDVPIDEALASRKHVRFRPAGDGWAVEDLGSRNGTLLNGEQLTGSAKLAPGDVVAIGSTVVEFLEQGGGERGSASRGGTRPARSSHRAAPQDPSAQAAGGAAPATAQAEEEAPFGAPGTVYELLFSGRCGEFTHLLDRPVVTVGRGDDADITISEDLASRVHCQFEVKASGLKVVDLESRNGTQVNGETINQRFLQREDVVTIGESEIRLRSRSPLTTNELDQRAVQAMAGAESERPTLGDEAPEPPHAGAPSGQPLPPSQAPVLVYTEGGREIRYRLTNETTVIGRSEKVALPIQELLASREHLIVRRLPNGAFEVEDLGSRNGTRVSGREVRGRIQLMPGDVIQVGETHMRFELPHPAAALPAGAPPAPAGMATPGGPHGQAPPLAPPAAPPASGYPPAGGAPQPYEEARPVRQNRRARPKVRAQPQSSGAPIIISVVVGLFAVIALVVALGGNGDGSGPTPAESDRNDGSEDGGRVVTNGETPSERDRPEDRTRREPRNDTSDPGSDSNDDPPQSAEEDEEEIPEGLRDPITGRRLPPTPERRPDLWVEEAENEEERRSRAAWVEQLEQANQLSSELRFGEALTGLDEFIEQWEDSLDAQHVLRLARNRASDIREAASQRWIVWQAEIRQKLEEGIEGEVIRAEYVPRIERSLYGIDRLYRDAMATLDELESGEERDESEEE